MDAYLALYAPAVADAIDEKGGRFGDYVAIGRFPSSAPVVLTREAARLGLGASGYGPVLGELDIPPSNDDEILWLYKVSNTPTWSRTQFGPRPVDAGTPGADVGDGVGARMPNHNVVPDRGGLDELPVSEATALGFLKLTEEWLKLGYEGVRELGEDPSKYINYVQWPPAEGQQVSTRVFPRSKVSEELRHLHGTKKYAQLLEHFETPCDDVMLVMDVVGREDICVMFRDKEKIPPFVLGKLTLEPQSDAP